MMVANEVRGRETTSMVLLEYAHLLCSVDIDVNSVSTGEYIHEKNLVKEEQVQQPLSVGATDHEMQEYESEKDVETLKPKSSSGNHFREMY